jgi:hypothetical protein
MKRQKVIAEYRKRLEEMQGAIKALTSVPLDAPIEITYREAYHNMSDAEQYHVVGIARTINNESFRLELIAVEKGQYPWNAPDRKLGRSHKSNYGVAKFQNILSWKLVVPEDLPTYISYDFTYPRLTHELKHSQSEKAA